MAEFDVIIIGGGIGGLVAGALCARRGFKTALYESHSSPGGYCASFRRKGFTFDACLDAVSGGGGRGWLSHVLRETESAAAVELVKLDPLRVDVFSGERIEIPGELGPFRELLYSIAPTEKSGIDNLLNAMESVFRMAMVTRPEVLYTDTRLNERGGLIGRFRKSTYKELLDNYIKSDKLRAVMSDRCAFVGLPPSRVSALAMTVMFMTFATGGGYRIKHGAQRLADALADSIRNHGGQVFLSSPVTEILKIGERVSGVLVGGEDIRAKAVVSAIDSAKTYGMIGLPLEPYMYPSISFFMSYLGLGKQLDIPDSMGVYPSYDIESTFSDIDYDIVSPKSSIEIINYSRISPSMAPDGGTTLMLMSKAEFDYKKSWYDCKQYEMERAIALAETAVPGLSGCISHAEAATPATLYRYTGNSCGAAFGWEQDAVNHRISALTSLPGLFLAGHWTYPGGGVESVAASGLVAADNVTKYIESEKFYGQQM